MPGGLLPGATTSGHGGRVTVDPAVLAARLEGARSLNAAVAWSPEALAAECARVSADGPLGGMPVAVKDNIVTAELPTTCASRILAGYRSPFTATAVTRLRAAG
ncbi:MAG: Asp-tRNA(Asn)/Glu-tRNA(Gln) amidotransferase GatCAB subunit A, partial [Gemmatimonadetes bacterium]|nr:Asp-tRNA(Asn)/Glu-tRNA(Gln) amidotransferase GatCAB subunit A [Gemmatimonadota bacterium]